MTVSTSKKSLGVGALMLTMMVALAAILGVYLYAGAYGLNVILRRGGSLWVSVRDDDARLSPSIRLALRAEPPKASSGQFSWGTVAEGFEVGELPVIAAGAEVDRVLLARIDPSRYRFLVRNARAGNKDVWDWIKE